MGMFDSFLVKLECPLCKKTELREIQTKQFANILAAYHVGDIVEDAPVGEFWLKDEWWCENCRKKKREYNHDIYLRLLEGLFLGVYTEQQYQEQRKKLLDTYEIMQLYKQSAHAGTNRRFLIQRIDSLIKGSRIQWKNETSSKGKFPFLLPKNNEELVKEIEEIINRFKENEPELDDKPSWL